MATDEAVHGLQANFKDEETWSPQYNYGELAELFNQCIITGNDIVVKKGEEIKQVRLTNWLNTNPPTAVGVDIEETAKKNNPHTWDSYTDKEKCKRAVWCTLPIEGIEEAFELNCTGCLFRNSALKPKLKYVTGANKIWH